jgi:hypothetical protein
VRLLLRFSLVLVAVFVGSTIAFAAGPTTVVSLSTAGGYLARNVALCGDGAARPYVYFHRQKPILIVGSVRPKPSGAWHVTVRVERCVGKTFRTLEQYRVTGRSNGTFQTLYRPSPVGIFSVGASYEAHGRSVRSNNVRLVVPKAS